MNAVCTRSKIYLSSTPITSRPFCLNHLGDPLSISPTFDHTHCLPAGRDHEFGLSATRARLTAAAHPIRNCHGKCQQVCRWDREVSGFSDKSVEVAVGDVIEWNTRWRDRRRRRKPRILISKRGRLTMCQDMALEVG
jgi:hypothetical protein